MSRSRFRALLAAAALAAGVAGAPTAAIPGDSLTSPRVPPDPTPEQVEQNLPQLGNPLNKPITGGSEDPLVVGTEPPPSPSANAICAAETTGGRIRVWPRPTGSTSVRKS